MVTNHEDILKRTLSGLEDDLDELREMLVRQIESFEGGIKQRIKELPVWLTLPYSKIKQVIRFPQDSSFHEALLGPRAVALAAGEIEDFVRTWVGQDGELADLTRTSQSNVARPWGRDASLLTVYLDNLEHEAQAVMIAARTSLIYMRDEILAELEEQRRVDCEALEELVARGDLEQGQQARKEIAELWEDQRRRANTFSRRWEDLEQHIERGLDITESGLDTLRDLLENAELGLSQAYPQASPEEIEALLEEEPAEFLPEQEEAPSSHDAFKVLSARDNTAEPDFDPYGEEPKEEPAPPVTSASPSKTGRKHINEDFFKSDEVNDDLIFADQSNLDGPMIDFGDEEPADQSASHHLFSSTLESSPSSTTPNSSPYEIFLGDDSDASLQDSPTLEPLVAKPARAPEDRPRQNEEPLPIAKQEPLEEVGAPYPRLALAEQELEEQELEEERSPAPLGALDLPASTGTVPYMASPFAHTDLTGAPDHPGVEDASIPTAPMLDDVEGTPTAPSPEALVDELDTPTLPAGGWDHDRSEPDEDLEVATVELVRELEPDEVEDEPQTQDEETREALTEQIIEGEEEEELDPVEELEPPPAPEPLGAEAPTPAPTRWPADATRRRQTRRPVAALELALAVGLPLLVVLVCAGQAAVASDISERWIATHMWARGLAFGACVWLLIGPMFFLQWTIGWRGARPVPCRTQTLRDEAELRIEDEVLEVGDERLTLEQLSDTSLERWEDHEQGTHGLKYCLGRGAKRPIIFVCEDTEDMPAPEGGHPLPRVERPTLNVWEVSELTLSQITQWARYEP